jgi:ribosomal protein S18 acetylase RimI-like enzyme
MKLINIDNRYISKYYFPHIADSEDLCYIAKIYMETFPKTVRSFLGMKTCIKYFSDLLDHSAYEIVVVENDLKIPIAFVVLHKERTCSLQDKWIFTNLINLFLFLLKNPSIVFHRISNRIRRIKNIGMAMSQHGKKEYIERLANSSYIDLIAVQKSFRNNQIGTTLLSYSIMLAQKMGKQCLKLTVDSRNTVAKKLYESIGFSKIHEDVNTKSIIYSIDI